MVHFVEAPFVEDKDVVEGVINRNVKKPEFGYIGIRRKGFKFGVGSNFLSKDKSIAFISGRIEDLVEFVKENELVVGTPVDDLLNVKVIIKESTEPFYPEQKPKINPQTMQVVTHNGMNIYRTSLLVDRDSKETDQLLSNDAVDGNNEGTKMTEEFIKESLDMLKNK